MKMYLYRRRLSLLGMTALVLILGVVQAAGQDRTIVFFGDSLTAGYGLADPDSQSYPAQVQQKIDGAHLHWHVVNAGLSGETSAGGLRRIDWVLRQPVDVFVLELGANDGLRGTAPGTMRDNLQAIIDRVRSTHPATRIILAGMMMPPSMGADYVKAYNGIFPALAAKNGLILIPFLLDGVAERPEFIQGDNLHPNATGAAIIANTVWKWVAPVLQ
jgi:acyl-CoA thioesterase-1